MCIEALLAAALWRLCWTSGLCGCEFCDGDLEHGADPPTHHHHAPGHGDLRGPPFFPQPPGKSEPPSGSWTSQDRLSHFCFRKKTCFSFPCQLLPLPLTWHRGEGPVKAAFLLVMLRGGTRELGGEGDNCWIRFLPLLVTVKGECSPVLSGE